jgi:uncharacterized membrane protein YfcA
VFAVGGALVSDHVDGRLLMVLTAVLMLWAGLSVVSGGRRSRPAPAALQVAPAERDRGIGAAVEGIEASETETAMAVEHGSDRDAAIAADAAIPRDVAIPGDVGGTARTRHALPLIALLGAGSGFVAGLLGVGGGIVMVPVLTGPLKVPMKSAVASSLVAVAIFSVPALVTHWILGHIDWTYALPLMVGVVPGARIGARLTIGASDRTIRLLFGVLIIVLAVVYGASEASGLF